MKLAETTAKQIEGVRDGYRPAAKRGAVLFFVLSEMAAINSMYQYSLSSYLDVSQLNWVYVMIDIVGLASTILAKTTIVEPILGRANLPIACTNTVQVFNVSLKRSMPDTHLPKRLNNIINTLTLNVYNYACTGMYTYNHVGHLCIISSVHRCFGLYLSVGIYVSFTVLCNFLTGLFEVHKLLFSFAMTTKIQEVESSLNHEELDFFIKV